MTNILTNISDKTCRNGSRVVANDNPKAAVLGRTLDNTTDLFLRNDKSPSRKVHELDNRGSHFYLALYWAQALAEQTDDADLQAAFTPIAAELASNEESIVREMIDVQGPPADLGGYYLVDEEKTSAVMRPSSTFNAIIASLG